MDVATIFSQSGQILKMKAEAAKSRFRLDEEKYLLEQGYFDLPELYNDNPIKQIPMNDIKPPMIEDTQIKAIK